MTLKIGVVVHGPGIVDSGQAQKIINMLKNYGEVSCRLGGTMGRTAVIDANLEDVINIEDKLLPSQSVELLSKTNDVLFLLNYGKSTITGHTFGYKVFNNANINVPLIQIERPGKNDGTIIKWSDIDNSLINNISKDLNLPVIDSQEVKEMVSNLTGYTKESGKVIRQVAGVSAGENVMVNGVVVAKATSDSLTVIAQNNRIIEMVGANIKQHGLDKLGSVDLSKAIIKTGLLRKSSNITPRIINRKHKDNTMVFFVNHAAEDIYQYKEGDLIVSVGDDTTLLSSDILYRFSIPIIGITDGDLDKVVLEGFKHGKSMIVQVESGYDDIIGDLIYEKIFSNKNKLMITDIDGFKNQILDLIKSSNISYKLVDKQLAD